MKEKNINPQRTDKLLNVTAVHALVHDEKLSTLNEAGPVPVLPQFTEISHLL